MAIDRVKVPTIYEYLRYCLTVTIIAVTANVYLLLGVIKWKWFDVYYQV